MPTDTKETKDLRPTDLSFAEITKGGEPLIPTEKSLSGGVIASGVVEQSTTDGEPADAPDPSTTAVDSKETKEKKEPDPNLGFGQVAVSIGGKVQMVSPDVANEINRARSNQSLGDKQEARIRDLESRLQNPAPVAAAPPNGSQTSPNLLKAMTEADDAFTAVDPKLRGIIPELTKTIAEAVVHEISRSRDGIIDEFSDQLAEQQKLIAPVLQTQAMTQDVIQIRHYTDGFGLEENVVHEVLGILRKDALERGTATEEEINSPMGRKAFIMEAVNETQRLKSTNLPTEVSQPAATEEVQPDANTSSNDVSTLVALLHSQGLDVTPLLAALKQGEPVPVGASVNTKRVQVSTAEVEARKNQAPEKKISTMAGLDANQVVLRKLGFK